MFLTRHSQVSLRGASAKEITRDALVQKVIQERELRQYARKAASSALFIQVPYIYLPSASAFLVFLARSTATD